MWLWIILALVLSYLPLINKKIELSNYIWLLIPIDAYGIQLAGTTIKPYMMVALILPIVFYFKNKGRDSDLGASKGQLLAGIIAILILLIGLINHSGIALIKASILLILVYICAQMYVSCSDPRYFEQLTDVFIASCFGFSIVFITGHILLNYNIDLAGIAADTRESAGMFLKQATVINRQYTEAYRLRGFAYDPNTMFIQFIFGICACVLKLFKKFKLYYVLTLVLSIFAIILSSSRMGLLCALFAVVIACIYSVSSFKTVKQKVLSIIAVLSACASFLVFTVTKYGQTFMSSLLSAYSNRSGLNDEYGRFSIWKESLKIYWEKNPLWGVGLGRMDEFTATGRMTHNTWLQFICECGVIVGGIVIIYFFTIMIMGWVKTNKIRIINPENTSYICLVIGYTATIISLISVDNITCSYLWFSAIMLLKMMSCSYDPDDIKKISSIT